MSETLRLPDSISKGKHKTPGEGMCVMETVAFIAGEPHTDHPPCACPVITEAAIRLNDSMPDDQTRTRILGPLAFRIAGTRATQSIEQERAYIAADWAVRVFSPIALDAGGRGADASRLRSLRRIVDFESANAAHAARAAYRATNAAARAATNAAYAAYAATNAAASAASAATNAANAAAYAANAATNAAYAAYAAAYAAYVATWEMAGQMLEAMIDLDHDAADRLLAR
jgi:hypothetical protein